MREWLCLLIALAATLLPSRTAAQSLLFRSPLNNSAGGMPVAIDAADVNLDGNVDAIVGVADGAANIFLNPDNDGDLRGCAREVSLPGTPSAVLLAFFDADSVPDLIATDTSNHRVWAWTGEVEGTGCNDVGFVPVANVEIATGLNPIALSSGFLDQDDQLDLVVANQGPEEGNGSVMVLQGGGDGTFTLIPQPAGGGETTDSLPAGDNTRAVAVADVDGDELDDLLVVNAGADSFMTFLGNGNGTFALHGEEATGRAPFSVAARMLNQDPHLDIAVADRNDDTVSVFLGSGDGSFEARRVHPVGIFPESIAVADLNGDGAADVATANRGSFDVTVLFGDGTGDFSAGRSFVADEEPIAIVLADLGGQTTGSGRADALAITANGTVISLMNRGDGSLDAVENLAVADVPSSIDVADVNDDALPDLVAVGENGSVQVFLAVPTGGFQPQESLPLGGNPRSVLAVDLDGDQRIDLAIADGERDQAAVAFGVGGGRFSGFERFSTAAEPVSMAAGDFNSDGRRDLAVAAGDQSGQVSVLLQSAGRRFQAARNTAVGQEPIAIVSEDLDGDSDDDLVVANNASATVVVLESLGNGSFRQAQILENDQIPANPVSLAIADFDADGAPDLAVGGVGTLGSSVVVSFGNGDATFEPVSGLPLGQVAVSLVARDFSGDQIADLAAVTPANQLVVAVSRGDRGFRTRAGDRVSRMPIDTAAGDFDGDGRYDAVTANNAATSQNLSVLWNCARDPGCATSQQIPGRAALRGDGNGDGRRSAADLVAVAAEVGDGDGRHVEAIGRSGFVAEPGVDANGDGRVDAQDRIAVVRRMFLS